MVRICISKPFGFAFCCVGLGVEGGRDCRGVGAGWDWGEGVGAGAVVWEGARGGGGCEDGGEVTGEGWEGGGVRVWLVVSAVDVGTASQRKYTIYMYTEAPHNGMLHMYIHCHVSHINMYIILTVAPLTHAHTHARTHEHT